MKGTIQLCKADVCLKADGDFAEALLLILAIVLIIAAIAAIAH
jgi:hypothetical protein